MYCFCVDFHRLNAVTKKDVTLGESKFFSSLDLASGYWQVNLDLDSHQKSAFATYFGVFEFVCMSFGLCNAPATLQGLMQKVLAGLEWHSCFVYLDDILVASRVFDEHVHHLSKVFTLLRCAGLHLNHVNVVCCVTKCLLWSRHLYRVGPGRLCQHNFGQNRCF